MCQLWYVATKTSARCISNGNEQFSNFSWLRWWFDVTMSCQTNLMCMLLCFCSINTNTNTTQGIIRFVKWYSTICFDNTVRHSFWTTHSPNMLTLTKLSIIFKQRKGKIADWFHCMQTHYKQFDEKKTTTKKLFSLGRCKQTNSQIDVKTWLIQFNYFVVSAISFIRQFRLFHLVRL